METSELLTYGAAYNTNLASVQSHYEMIQNVYAEYPDSSESIVLVTEFWQVPSFPFLLCWQYQLPNHDVQDNGIEGGLQSMQAHSIPQDFPC